MRAARLHDGDLKSRPPLHRRRTHGYPTTMNIRAPLSSRWTRRRVLHAASTFGLLAAVGPTTTSVSGEPRQQSAPPFVDHYGPADVLSYLGSVRGGINWLHNFCAANIVETMDTVLMDSIYANFGADGLGVMYDLIARHVLTALLDTYGSIPLLLALDAGHGGNPAVYFDPGANGTEHWHTRGVTDAVERLAGRPPYASIVVRRLFNDAVGDDFGMPRGYDCDGSNLVVMRLMRAAILAGELSAWNRANPARAHAMHLLSIHFNAESSSILVLHQGATIDRDFQEASISFAINYVNRTLPAINNSGLLPYAQGLGLGTGLSDDRLLYHGVDCYSVNPYTGVSQASLPRRYALLLASETAKDFVHGMLIAHGFEG